MPVLAPRREASASRIGGLVLLDSRPIEPAGGVIAPHGTFAILAGRDLPFSHEIFGRTVPAWIPRRRLADAASAD